MDNSTKPKKNPILVLGKRYMANPLPPEELQREIKSFWFAYFWEEKYCIQVADLIIDTIENSQQYNCKELLTYSYMNRCLGDTYPLTESTYGKIFYSHGMITSIAGNFPESIESLEIARKIFLKNSIQESVAFCEKRLGYIYYTQKQYEKSVTFYLSAKSIFDNNNNKKYNSASCAVDLAMSYIGLGQYDTANTLFIEGIRILKEKSNYRTVAIANLNFGNSFIERGLHDKGIEFHKIARAINEENGDEIGVAECNFNMACSYLSTLKLDNSIELLMCAKQIFEKNKLDINVARCNNGLASNYSFKGEFEKVLSLFNSSHAIYSKNGMILEALKTEAEIAYLYNRMCDYQKSVELHQDCMRKFKSSNLNVDSAICALNMSNPLITLGQYDEALKVINYDRGIFEEHKLIIQMAQCDRNKGSIYRLLIQPDESVKYYQSAKKIFEQIGSEVEVANCDVDIANIFTFYHQYDQSFRLIKSAQKIFEANGMEQNVLLCKLNSAALLLFWGRYEESKAITNELSNQYDHTSYVKYQVNFIKGLLYKYQGDFKQANRFFIDSAETIESIRESINQGHTQISYFGKFSSYYHEIIDNFLKDNNFSLAFEYVERLKNRTLFEMLLHRDLIPLNASENEKEEYLRSRSKIRSHSNRLRGENNYNNAIVLKTELDKLEEEHLNIIDNLKKYDPEYDPDQKLVFSYSDIKNVLTKDDCLLVEIYPMYDKVCLFILSPDKDINESTLIIQDINIPILMNRIVEIVKEFLQYYESKFADKQKAKTHLERWKNYLDNILRELYDKLFLKLVPHLGNTKEIVLIPFSMFHWLPLHAMFYENNNRRRYVIDDYNITYSPSSKIFKLCKERIKAKQKSAYKNVTVAHANPKNDLLFSQLEVQAIKSFFNEAKLAQKVTKKDFITLARDAQILHYIGHANMKELYLHNEQDNSIEDEFSIDDIFENLYLKNTELVILSGCETGLPDLDTIDEYICLPSAFLYAGTSSVISSLWSVSDISTSLLMTKMYQFIKEGKGNAESLRNAQLWLKDPANRQEQIKIIQECFDRKEIMTDRQRFMVDAIDSDLISEECFPDDFSEPYYWAGFICSGAN